MFAECSLCIGVRVWGLSGGPGKRDLTVLALPDEVGLATTAAHFVHFLRSGQTGCKWVVGGGTVRTKRVMVTKLG
jgi:hypothetical protein